jgi:hypothetical protein
MVACEAGAHSRIVSSSEQEAERVIIPSRRKADFGGLAAVPNSQQASVSRQAIEKEFRVTVATNDPRRDAFIGFGVEAAGHCAVQVGADLNQVVTFDHGLAQEVFVV